MKADIRVQAEVHLTMTPAEAIWLRDYLQNGPPGESQGDIDRRGAFFDTIKEALRSAADIGRMGPIHE